MPTVSTANVNGVRAAAGKGLLEWVSGSDAEAICLQEVRALPEEIPAALTDLLADRGWWREMLVCGDWWTYRGRAFDNDVGWRIDHQLATPGLAARAKDAVVERADSHDRRWSDHAPVTVRYAPS